MQKKLLAITFASLLLTTSMVLAEEESSSSSASSSSSSSTMSEHGKEKQEKREGHGMKAAKTLNVACIQAAVTEREDAVIAAIQTFFEAKIAARTRLRDALVDAWALPDATSRKAARKNAEMAFKQATLSARKAWLEARMNAKKTFKTEHKACNVPSEPEPDANANPSA
jgi:hypothetical protein